MNKIKPQVSLLMLNWNGIAYTRKSIQSLLKIKDCTYEIILVDNGSDNKEGDRLEEEFKNKITVIKNEKNLGYAQGMNIAYSQAKGDYIGVVNNDMEFKPDWLKIILAVLGKNKKIAACQPKLLNLKNKKYFDYASAAGGFIDIFGYGFARGRLFAEIEKDDGQYDEIIKIAWNGIFVVKKKVLEKIGFFKAIYFNYGEDMDLCYRMYGQGYIVVSVPSSIVYHLSGSALKKNMEKKMFFHHRNNLILILINWPINYLFFVLAIRFMLDIFSIFYYFAIHLREGAKGVVGAYISLFRILSQVIEERKRTQKLIDKKNIAQMPLYKGSIVWDFFVLRKKRFDEIIKDKNLYSIDIIR